MNRKLPRIMIAAVKSGSGKTMVTCSLLAAIKERGITPHAFKCGPDYIDPMFHRTVIDVPSDNLDGFFLEKEQLCELFCRNMQQKELAVIEGVMGLFDGIGGISCEGSAYDLAAALQIPIVLVIDAHGMGRSVLALLHGCLHYDNKNLIAGVLLNKTSAAFYRSIAPLIEQELSVPVLGYLPKNEKLALESRHLGLKLPHEIEGLREQLREAARLLEESVEVERLLSIAYQAKELSVPEREILKTTVRQIDTGAGRVRIGVARDEAFCFYYEENLKLLERMGAQLVFFSPLHEPSLPKELDGLLLGGGYPELYAQQLEQNASMRADIDAAITSGIAVVAECGGFLYLHKTLVDEKGARHEMCGVLPGSCYYTGRLVRFGYIGLTEKTAHFLPEHTVIKGHEFHYYDSDDNGDACLAKKPVTNRSWECVHAGRRRFLGFAHLYYPSNPHFAQHFIEQAREYQRERKEVC